jgi:hypothetical protein
VTGPTGTSGNSPYTIYTLAQILTTELATSWTAGTATVFTAKNATIQLVTNGSDTGIRYISVLNEFGGVAVDGRLIIFEYRATLYDNSNSLILVGDSNLPDTQQFRFFILPFGSTSSVTLTDGQNATFIYIKNYHLRQNTSGFPLVGGWVLLNTTGTIA